MHPETLNTAPMIQKRYQFRAKDGVRWTPWFDTRLTDFPNERWQILNKLKNEYRYEPKEIHG